MIGTPDRKRAVRLIKEATNAGARTNSACREMGISMRTFQRWTQEDDVRTDGRPNADRPAPDNKMVAPTRTVQHPTTS
jgi:transposase-like protein